MPRPTLRPEPDLTRRAACKEVDIHRQPDAGFRGRNWLAQEEIATPIGPVAARCPAQPESAQRLALLAEGDLERLARQEREAGPLPDLDPTTAFRSQAPAARQHVKQAGHRRRRDRADPTAARGPLDLDLSPLEISQGEDQPPTNPGRIGIPGDSIEMHNNQLVINGEKVTYEPVDHLRDSLQLLNEDFARYGLIENLKGERHPVQFVPRPGVMTSFPLKSIPDGKYFMMGDNRNNSLDSRVFEFVDRNQIIGKATSVFYSVDINNYYKPRWERFFAKLP